ncbi:MAG: hypothetical protein ACEQR8_06490 [Cypionkella sp.]
MEHTRIEPAEPATAADPAAARVEAPDVRHDGWTPEKQARFLRELAATHCVSQAARSVGMARQSAYRLRARLKGEPFDIAWRAALQRQLDALHDALVERAIHGVEVPHFHNGELIHVSRRFDERTALALLAARSEGGPAARCYAAEDEQIDIADFDALMTRIEHGDERWRRNRRRR